MIFGEKSNDCMGCPELLGVGAGGLWFRCVQTNRVLSNLAVRPSDCPYLKNERDAGDVWMDAITRAIAAAAEQAGQLEDYEGQGE